MNTREKDRGRQFFQKIQIWKILLESKQPLNKQKLAQIVYNTSKTTEAQKRSVQRTADILVKLGVVVKCDNQGNPLPEWVLLRKLKNNPFEERYWIANQEASWAKTLWTRK